MSKPSELLPIKIGIIGVGNCCSSLVQGIEYYKKTVI
jgi:myo-inositol-1-phosphate synthase